MKGKHAWRQEKDMGVSTDVFIERSKFFEVVKY